MLLLLVLLCRCVVAATGTYENFLGKIASGFAILGRKKTSSPTLLISPTSPKTENGDTISVLSTPDKQNKTPYRSPENLGESKNRDPKTAKKRNNERTRTLSSRDIFTLEPSSTKRLITQLLQCQRSAEIFLMRSGWVGCWVGLVYCLRYTTESSKHSFKSQKHFVEAWAPSPTIPRNFLDCCLSRFIFFFPTPQPTSIL